MHVLRPEKIRQERKLRDWSQRKLAALCERSQNAIHLVETRPDKGCRQISEDFAMALCRELEIRPEGVFGDIPAKFTAALPIASESVDLGVSA